MFGNLSTDETIVKRFKKRTCECDEVYTTYHVAAAGCADDAAAVAALPDTWVPKHSGPILTNYLKKREQDHDKTLQDIVDRAKAVNDVIDSKVRTLAEALLAHIQHNNKQIECTLQSYDTGNTALDKEQRDEALKRIYQLHSQRIDEITYFNREASGLERERAEELRSMLRDHFQRLINIGHLTPKDLLHDFDDRIYQINQQLLSNNRAYVELEAQLRVQAEDRVTRARSVINQLCLVKSTRNRTLSAMTYSSDERAVLHRPVSAIGDKISELSMPTHFSTIAEAEGLDECVIRLVHAYKAAVTRVYNGFSDRLSDLEKDLVTHHFVTNLDSHTCQMIDFHQMIDRAVGRLSTSVHKKQMATRELLEATASDMIAMQKSLWSLGESLQDTFNVLHDAGHLWDGHILRQALAQKLTIAAVEDLFTTNDAIQMTNEVAFNVTLERLRGAPDSDKLQVEYGLAKGMLEQIGEMYRIHSEAELGRLEEFMKLSIPLADTLLSEIQCFLEKYPRLPHSSLQIADCPPNLEHPSPTPRHANDSILSPLPRAILETELQQLALCNWRNGFLESFESNVSQVSDELRRQARRWVEERANALHMRYSLKIVSHSVRLERINAARDMRLSELNHHERRLESHLDALYQLVNDLPQNVSQFPPAGSSYLYPLMERISQIQENINTLTESTELTDPETKRLKMCSYAPRLLRHRQLYEDSLNNAIESYKRLVEHQVQNARIAGVRFMSHISLLREGGNYTAHEAMRACSALVKGADALESCVSNVTEALNNRRNQLMAAADLLLSPLQKLCDDVLGKKGVKGKPPPKKK